MSAVLIQELISDLTIELKDDDAFDSAKLEQKVRNAVREVKHARRYPTTYTETQISNDLEQHYSCIRNIALYDYNTIGIEGEISHAENGISRSYTERKMLFNGVLPLSRI